MQCARDELLAGPAGTGHKSMLRARRGLGNLASKLPSSNRFPHDAVSVGIPKREVSHGYRRRVSAANEEELKVAPDVDDVSRAQPRLRNGSLVDPQDCLADVAQLDLAGFAAEQPLIARDPPIGDGGRLAVPPRAHRREQGS